MIKGTHFFGRWWDARLPRERLLLTILSVVAAASLLVLGAEPVVQSAMVRVAALQVEKEKQLAVTMSQLSRLRYTVRQIEQIEARRKKKIAVPQSLGARLAGGAAAARVNLTSSAPASPDGWRLEASSVPSPILFSWMAWIETDQGANIERAYVYKTLPHGVGADILVRQGVKKTGAKKTGAKARAKVGGSAGQAPPASKRGK